MQETTLLQQFTRPVNRSSLNKTKIPLTDRRQRELGFLVAHSMLHLFGYDHMEEEEREQMEARQREILNGLSILR